MTGPILCFVIGPTNAGKSTFLKKAHDYRRRSIGLVEVGKMMREKYPPEYFQGQASPAHTQAEAWSMMLEGISQHEDAGKQLILIDGQPRDLGQLDGILHMKGMRVFLHLYAPLEERKERALARDGSDPGKLKLSMARMEGDAVNLYEIITRLHMVQSYDDLIRFWTFETSYSFNPFGVVDRLLNLSELSEELLNS